MILTPPRAPTINQGLRIVNGMYGDQLEGMRLSIAVPGEPDFADRMQRAFEFLRRYASNHYTPSSLIKVMSAAEWTRHSGDGPPMLIDIETPFSFDPETEVKLSLIHI